MKISFSATNPCHIFPFARELAGRGELGCYYSGYPEWKLRNAGGMRIRANSIRTNIVYGALKFLPAWARPAPHRMFRWQDRAFDAWVGRTLESCDDIHAIPGQARETFRRARELGIRTVLNHATGPVRDWMRILEPEYASAGLRLADHCPYDAAYFAREDEEYALADFHCAASTVVERQLMARGIDRDRIWRVPYGADRDVFFPRESPGAGGFRIVFAGQVCLRKGIATLLRALELAPDPNKWQVDFYGAILPESARDIRSYAGRVRLNFHGPVAQSALAEAFREGTVLVLPSLEEGFGLVVPQALNCGLPCIVTDRVGASDLIDHRENGSVFAVQDSAALLEELLFWENNQHRVDCVLDWSSPAQQLLCYSARTAP